MTDVALPPVASAAPRRQVAAWALWDWGSAAFGPDERGTAWLSTAMAVAGVASGWG